MRVRVRVRLIDDTCEQGRKLVDLSGCGIGIRMGIAIGFASRLEMFAPLFDSLASLVGSSWDLGFQMSPGWVRPCAERSDSPVAEMQRCRLASQ